MSRVSTFVPQGQWYDDCLGEWVPNGYHWEKDNGGNYSLFHDNNDEEGDEEGSDEDGDDDEGDDKPEVSGNEKKEKVDSDSSCGRRCCGARTGRSPSAAPGSARRSAVSPLSPRVPIVLVLTGCLFKSEIGNRKSAEERGSGHAHWFLNCVYVPPVSKYRPHASVPRCPYQRPRM